MTLRRRGVLVGLVALLGLAGCSSTTPVATAPSSSAGGSGTTSTVAPSTGSTSLTTTTGGSAAAPDAALRARLLVVEDLPGEGWVVDDSLTKIPGTTTTTSPGAVLKDLCPGVATPAAITLGASSDHFVGFGNEPMRAAVIYGIAALDREQAAAAFADLRPVLEQCLGKTKGTGELALDSEMSLIDLPTLGEESVALHVVALSPTSNNVISDQHAVIGRKGAALILLGVETTPSRSGDEPQPDVVKIIEAANAKLEGL